MTTAIRRTCTYVCIYIGGYIQSAQHSFIPLDLSKACMKHMLVGMLETFNMRYQIVFDSFTWENYNRIDGATHIRNASEIFRGDPGC